MNSSVSARPLHGVLEKTWAGVSLRLAKFVRRTVVHMALLLLPRYVTPETVSRQSGTG